MRSEKKILSKAGFYSMLTFPHLKGRSIKPALSIFLHSIYTKECISTLNMSGKSR